MSTALSDIVNRLMMIKATAELAASRRINNGSILLQQQQQPHPAASIAPGLRTRRRAAEDGVHDVVDVVYAAGRRPLGCGKKMFSL